MLQRSGHCCTERVDGATPDPWLRLARVQAVELQYLELLMLMYEQLGCPEAAALFALAAAKQVSRRRACSVNSPGSCPGLWGGSSERRRPRT